MFGLLSLLNIPTWVYMASLSAVLFGLGDFIVVYSEQNRMNVVTLYMTYTIIIGLLNLLYMIFIKKDSLNQVMSFTSFDWSIISLLCAFYLFAYLLHFVAIQRATNPGYANALVMFHVIVLSVLSYLYLNKPLNSKAVFGVVLMFAGALLITIYSKIK